MVVLDGNCAVGCGPAKDCPEIRIFQCMLERTDAITNEVLEPITFVLAHPTLPTYTASYSSRMQYSSVSRSVDNIGMLYLYLDCVEAKLIWS
jgi:hypothetical protein